MAATVAMATPAHAVDMAKAGFQITTPPASAPPGVSPEVVYDAATSTYYLITTNNPPSQYRSSDGVNWTPVGNTLPQGVDWSIVQEGPRSYRLYYAEMLSSGPGAAPAPPCTPGTKQLRYATSSDLVTWTPRPVFCSRTLAAEYRT
jgi:hypothetical protein